MSKYNPSNTANWGNPMQIEIRKRCEKKPVLKVCRFYSKGCKVHDAPGFYYFRCAVSAKKEEE